MQKISQNVKLVCQTLSQLGGNFLTPNFGIFITIGEIEILREIFLFSMAKLGVVSSEINMGGNNESFLPTTLALSYIHNLTRKTPFSGFCFPSYYEFMINL